MINSVQNPKETFVTCSESDSELFFLTLIELSNLPDIIITAKIFKLQVSAKWAHVQIFEICLFDLLTMILQLLVSEKCVQLLKVFHLYVCGSSPSEPLLRKLTSVLFCDVSMFCWVPVVLPFMAPVKRRCLRLLLSFSPHPPPSPRGGFTSDVRLWLSGGFRLPLETGTLRHSKWRDREVWW